MHKIAKNYVYTLWDIAQARYHNNTILYTDLHVSIGSYMHGSMHTARICNGPHMRFHMNFTSKVILHQVPLNGHWIDQKGPNYAYKFTYIKRTPMSV